MVQLVLELNKSWLYSKKPGEELGKTEAGIHELLDKLQVDCRLYELAHNPVRAAGIQPLFELFLTKVWKNSELP